MLKIRSRLDKGAVLGLYTILHILQTIMTLQEDAARKVFQQMLDALDYCHKLGIYHR